MRLLPSPGNFRDAMVLMGLAVLAIIAISVCVALDDSSEGEALNPLEAAAEELLPNDATVLERTDSVCIYGRPQPSCEFVMFVREGVPLSQRMQQVMEQADLSGWTIVDETRYNERGQSGGALIELSKGERYARWWLKPDEWNAECLDGADPDSCADMISMY